MNLLGEVGHHIVATEQATGLYNGKDDENTATAEDPPKSDEEE